LDRSFATVTYWRMFPSFHSRSALIQEKIPSREHQIYRNHVV
jgi:hypothetical protein